MLSLAKLFKEMLLRKNEDYNYIKRIKFELRFPRTL